jgi:cytochrome P450
MCFHDENYSFLYFSGQEWRKLRKLMSPAFSPGIVEVYSEVFKINSEILVQIFRAKVGAGEFDVCPYLNLFTLDSIIGEYIECNLRNFQLFHSVFLSVNSYDIHKFCDKCRHCTTVVLRSIFSVGY